MRTVTGRMLDVRFEPARKELVRTMTTQDQIVTGKARMTITIEVDEVHQTDDEYRAPDPMTPVELKIGYDLPFAPPPSTGMEVTDDPRSASW